MFNIPKSREERLENVISVTYGMMEQAHYNTLCILVNEKNKNKLLIQENENLKSQLAGAQAELLGIRDLGMGI